jgi:hypothetical protein
MKKLHTTDFSSLVSAAVNQGPVSKRSDPFGTVAPLAIGRGKLSFDIVFIAGFAVGPARAVARFTPCIPEMRGFLFGAETARLSITGGVALIAALQFRVGQLLFHQNDTFV